MAARLRIFPDRRSGDEAVEQSASSIELVVLSLDRNRFYLKRPSPRLGVEPTYLCTDGRWRKYDRIVDLPHSSAAKTSKVSDG